MRLLVKCLQRKKVILHPKLNARVRHRKKKAHPVKQNLHLLDQKTKGAVSPSGSFPSSSVQPGCELRYLFKKKISF